MCISCSGLHLKDSILNSEEGDIKGSSTKIENENILLLSLLIKSVGNGGGSGFVQDSDNVKSSNGSGIFGGLSLGIIEIGGDGNDSVNDIRSDICFSDFLHFGKNHGGDFFRGVGFFSSFELGFDIRFSVFVNDFIRHEFFVLLDGFVSEFSTDKSFNIIEGSDGVNGSLIFGGFSDKSFFVIHSDDGGGNTVSEFIGNDFDISVFIKSDTRVSGSEIDTNHGTLNFVRFFFLISVHSCERKNNDQ